MCSVSLGKTHEGGVGWGGGGGSYVGTFVCVRGVLRICRHFLMPNATLVDIFMMIHWKSNIRK